MSLRSRYEQFDRKGRLWGQRQVDRGWRRPSFIGLTVWVLVVLVFLLWSANR